MNVSISMNLPMYFLIVLAVAIPCVVAWCMIFKKAGIHPGKFFIPIYGQWLAYDIADSGGIFVTTLVLSGVYSFIGSITKASATWTFRGFSTRSGHASASIGSVILVLFLVVLLILTILYFFRLSRKFGKGGWFAVGLTLLYPIFICILGFGPAKYLGYKRH